MSTDVVELLRFNCIFGDTLSHLRLVQPKPRDMSSKQAGMPALPGRGAVSVKGMKGNERSPRAAILVYIVLTTVRVKGLATPLAPAKSGDVLVKNDEVLY